MPKFDVVAIGSSTRDVLLKSGDFEIRKHEDSPTGVEQCFPLGSKMEIKEIFFTSGGGGTNAAVTFARQGFKTACVGVVGEDVSGEEILWELKKEGVNVDMFQKHNDGFTAYSIIMVNPNGERTIMSFKGEGQHFQVKKMPIEKIDSDWMYLDSMGGHYDLMWSLVNHAAKKGIKIAMNPGGKELEHGLEKLKPIMQHVDVFLTNKEEAAGLLKVRSQNWNIVLEKMSKIVKGITIISDGHNGVKVSDKKYIYSAGVPDSPVIERTGAGDAFGSGFTSEYMRSGSIEKAIQFATANSSSVVTKFGAKEGILKKGDFGPWPLVEVTKKKA
jgi:ribokinase